MFHLKYPRFRGFFAWDELGCLSRALGFPVDIFKTNLTDEIHKEENGLPLQETIKVLDYKLLYKSLHLTQNLHTADWNSCVFRRCVHFLEHHALTYEDINNARVAYQAYEAGDMKGMVLNQHVLMRTLKMCNKTISPLKLMHRIKHSKDMYDEPSRIQLYEFLDLLLWADGYQEYIRDETYGHFEMEDNLFKLTDFNHLLAHHDARVANRLDAQYLHEEWEFPEVKVKDKLKFKNETVICGDSRVEMTQHQKKSYRYLRSEVMKSENLVHCVKGGFVRERPVTAPNLGMYNQRQVQEYKRRQSQRAQSAIYSKLQNLLRQAYNNNADTGIKPVDMSDRPVIEPYKRCQTPKVVSDSELQETAEGWERLLFDIETEEGRYEIAMDTEMEAFIPKFKQRKEEMEKNKKPAPTPAKFVSSSQKGNKYEGPVHSLAYPVPRIPPAHSRKCDARDNLERLQKVFRGWYGARSKKGSHYILMSPFFHNSPKGQLFQKLAKMSDEEIKKLHGYFLHRKTKSKDLDQRPVTAPAVMTMEEYQSKMKESAESSARLQDSKNSRQSSGYGTMDEQSNKETPSPTSKPAVDFFIVNKSPELDEGTLNEVTENSNHLPDAGSVTETLAESKDSVDTSLSDQIRLLVTDSEKETDLQAIKPRAKSAYTQRNEQLQNGDPLQMKAAEGRYPRSKSVAGTCVVPDVDDIAPMPYMDHSRAKVVSVGSIGKISLLEDISEAKYWEDLALEQQKQKLKANLQTAKKNPQSVEEKPETVKNPEITEGASKAFEEEAADDIFIEEKISSHSGKKKGKAKSKDLTDGHDILSLILEEEKRRKTKARRYNSKPKFGYSSAKSWKETTTNSRTCRISSSVSRSSDSSGKTSSELDPQKKSYPKPTSEIEGKLNHMPEKVEEKVSQGQKKVTVKDHKESKQSDGKIPVNKYARLIKRLGDDMTPYLKKQMLKAVS